jgi:hypothetical protein
LEGPRHKAGDRSCDQDASCATAAHIATNLLNEIQRAIDVGIDDIGPGFEILIQEALTEPNACVGEQSINRTAVELCIKFVASFRRCEVSLKGIDLGAERRKLTGGRLNRKFVGRHDEIESIANAAGGKFKPMPLDAPVTIASGRT